jgi:hypothetical protein
VEAYSVNKADPQTTLKVMQTLLAGLPDVRMDIDPKTNNLIVLARPPQHATIRATLEKMQHDVQGGTDANEKPTDMAGPPFGGQGGQGGWMGGQGFGGPGMGPGWMGGQGFGRGGPGDRPPQMAGPNFQGPDAGSHRMGGSPFIGPEGRPWAGPGYGPPHRWAAFGPMQQRPWQQFRHYGQPNRHWQANFQRPNHPGMAYGARPQGPWQQYGHYGPPNRHWQANFQRPNHPGKAYGARPQHPWQQYGHYGPPNSHWQANYERPQRPQFSPKTLFERLDTNNDNQLSFEEFSQGMKHLLKNFLPGPGPQWARPVGLFGGQGFGPPAYHAMANYPASRSEIIGEKIAMIFQTFDKNHDGKLTKDEAPPMIQKNFDRIDVDKKGFVTPRDLYRAITQMRQRAEAQKSVDQGAQTKPEKNETKDKSE